SAGILEYADQLSDSSIDDSADGSKCFAKVVDVGNLACLGTAMNTPSIQSADLLRTVGVLEDGNVCAFRGLVEPIGREFMNYIFQTGFFGRRTLLFGPFAVT